MLASIPLSFNMLPCCLKPGTRYEHTNEQMKRGGGFMPLRLTKIKVRAIPRSLGVPLWEFINVAISSYPRPCDHGLNFGQWVNAAVV